MTIQAATSAKTHDSHHAKGATELLRADHKLVSGLFTEYENAKSSAKKKTLVSQICSSLTAHVQIEEEIFYPAVKRALEDKELVPEALVEHSTIKNLIKEVVDIEPDGEMFDAKIHVMSEYVKHHVKEEHDEMFPKAEKSKLDMIELGSKMATRKAELEA